MQQFFFFLKLLIIAFVSYVQKSPHDNVNGGAFILYILERMHIIAYFDFINMKNACLS